MQRVATFTKIHGKGNEGFEVIMNDVINKEYERLRALDMERIAQIENEYAMEMKCMRLCMDSTTEQRNELLAKDLVKIRARIAQPKGIRHKAKRIFEFIMACIFGWFEAISLYVRKGLKRK